MHAIRLEKTVLALVRIRPIVPGDEWPIRPAERRRFKRGHRELLMNFSAAHVYSERAVTVPSHRLSRLCYVLTFTRAFCVPPCLKRLLTNAILLLVHHRSGGAYRSCERGA